MPNALGLFQELRDYGAQYWLTGTDRRVDGWIRKPPFMLW